MIYTIQLALSHGDATGKSYIEIAEEILKDIEKAGMIPPSYVQKVFSVPEVSSGYKKLNEWESEE